MRFDQLQPPALYEAELNFSVHRSVLVVYTKSYSKTAILFQTVVKMQRKLFLSVHYDNGPVCSLVSFATVDLYLYFNMSPVSYEKMCTPLEYIIPFNIEGNNLSLKLYIQNIKGFLRVSSDIQDLQVVFTMDIEFRWSNY